MAQTIEKLKKYFQDLNPGKNIDRLFEDGVKIGVYGSSFDPITNVHLWTASTVAHRKKLDFILFLPSIGKARRGKTLQTEDIHREEMVKMAIAKDDRFILDTYEMHVLPEKQYTYFTMEHFKEILPNAEFHFVMGADLLVDIANGEWRMDEELISRNKFIIMARNGIDMPATISKSALLRNHDDGRFQLLDKGLAMEISSTYIRQEFSFGGEPQYLLPHECYQYIKEKGLYKEVIRS